MPDSIPQSLARMMTPEERSRRYASQKLHALRSRSPKARLSGDRPILGFDIDGVLSPLGTGFDTPFARVGFRWAGDIPGNLAHPFWEPKCVVHPLLPEWIKALNDAFECVWISSWAFECAAFAANAGLEAAVEWPHVSLSGVESRDEEEGADSFDVRPGPVEKLQLAERWVPDDAAFAVVDDALAGWDKDEVMHEEGKVFIARRQGPTLLLAPPKRIGLCQANVDFLLDFARAPTDSRFRFDKPIPLPERYADSKGGTFGWPPLVSRDVRDPVVIDDDVRKEDVVCDAKEWGALWAACCDPFGLGHHRRRGERDAESAAVARAWDAPREPLSTAVVTLPGSGRRWGVGLPCLGGVVAERSVRGRRFREASGDQLARLLDPYAFTPLSQMPAGQAVRRLTALDLVVRTALFALKTLLDLVPERWRERFGLPDVDRVVLHVVRG